MGDGRQRTARRFGRPEETRKERDGTEMKEDTE